MKLTRLCIRRLPGIEKRFELGSRELASALHVVHGPNGSGKSSLVRALRAVLWPELVPGEAVEVEAGFETRDAKWFVHRDGSRIDWQRDGVSTTAPPLPPVELATSFLVTIEDVTQLDAQDFESRVQSALAGGVDFATLERHWKWTDHSAKDAGRRLREARRALDQCDAASSALDRELQDSAAIEEDIHALEKVRDDGQVLTHLLELADAEVEHEAIAKRLPEFPEGMERLSGNESERMRELEDASSAAEKAEIEANEHIARLEERARELVLSEPLAEAELATLDGLVQSWQEAERALDGARVELEQAKEAERAATRRCPEGAKPEALLISSPRTAASLDRLVRDGASLEAERTALRAEAARLPASAEGPTTEKLAEAISALRGWLREPEPRADENGSFPWLLVVVGCAGFVVAGILAHPSCFLGVLVVLALGFLTARVRRAVPVDRSPFQRQYEALRLGALDWTRSAVEARLCELEAEQSMARDRARIDERRRDLSRGLEELDRRWSELELLRSEVRAELGVDALAPDFELQAFVAAVARLRDARDARATREAALVERERLRELAARKARESLGRHGPRTAGSVEEARGMLTELRERSRDLHDVVSARKRAEADLVAARTARERASAASRGFWAGLGLDVGAVAELSRRVGRLSEYRELKAKQRQHELAAELLRKKLGERASEVQQGRVELERRQLEARNAGPRISELERGLGGLRTRVSGARQEFARENAARLVARHRADLEEELRAARRSVIGGFLLNEVKSEYERLSQPEVLRRAGRSLERFTHGRYGLHGVSGVGLRVIDRRLEGRGLALAELSTGTRAQLFLALRQAFAAEAAGGERVPFVLDDALATSDPERMRAIGDALLDAARADGWQVVYLTTDRADVEVLFGRDAIGVDVIDLAALREGQRATLTRERLAEAAAWSAPSPEGRSAEDYGVLIGVPPIDAHEGLAGLHPFYVLRDDLRSLQRVLDARCTTVGEVRAQLELRPDLLDSEAVNGLGTWSAVALQTIAAWTVGRGKPVDREVLAHPESGVSGVFLEQLVEVAREVGGDAKGLLNAIAEGDPRTKGFGAKKSDRLRQFLEERGHFDTRATLEREDAWRRVFLEDLGAARPETSAVRARFEWLWSELDRGAGMIRREHQG